MAFQLVVITPPTTSPGELSTARALFERGLQALHVRKPQASEEEVKAYLQELPPAYRRRCQLHQVGRDSLRWGFCAAVRAALSCWTAGTALTPCAPLQPFPAAPPARKADGHQGHPLQGG